MSKFLDLTGLTALAEHINNSLDTKVDKEQGKVLSSNDFTDEYKDKLESIAADATKVSVDDTIDSSSTNPVQNKVIKTELDKKLNASLKGANSGVAELDENGKVPAAQLPGYVDDVVEGYYYNKKFYKESTHASEIAGEAGIIYVDLSANKTYRWSGTAFAEISASLALGTTSSTAGRGDWTKAAYDHSNEAHAPAEAEENQPAFSKITVGSTDVAATDKTDTFTIVQGSNVKLTADAAGRKVTIAATNTTYANATQSKAGLMSGTDKKKLDEIESITTQEIDELFA